MPKYDEETVRAIIEETNQLFNKMVQLGGMDKDDNAVKLSKIYHKDCMDRNKKYLQAYEVYRMDKVRQLGWLSGGSAAIIPKNILENEILSLDEIDYFTAYNKAISDYSDAVNIDLTSSIEVRNAECGLICVFYTTLYWNKCNPSPFLIIMLYDGYSLPKSISL